VVKAALRRSFGKIAFSRELASLQGLCPVLDGTCSDYARFCTEGGGERAVLALSGYYWTTVGGPRAFRRVFG